MAREHFRFQRGDYVRDIITGFSGIVVSRSDSITGCDQYCIQPTQLDGGKMVDARWFDDQCLEYDPAHLNEKVDLQLRHDQPPG